MKANTVKKLKNELKFLYDKYKYNLYMNLPKFNNVFSQLMLQEPEQKIKDEKEVLLAGLLAKNIFYTKQEKLDIGGSENGENE